MKREFFRAVYQMKDHKLTLKLRRMILMDYKAPRRCIVLMGQINA